MFESILGNFHFDKLDIYLVLLVLIFCAVVFKLRPSLPTIQTIQTSVELLNTKGGIIALLGTMTMVFFFTGLHFVYWSADLIKSGKVDPNNAIIISGFNWITGIAFGGVFGAMIKTMTGESPPSSSSSTTITTPSSTPGKTVVSTASNTVEVVPVVEKPIEP